MATSLDALLSQMALDNEAFNRLIQQLEADRKAYLATFEKIHSSLSQGLHSQPNASSPEQTSTSRPSISSLTALPLSEVAQPAGSSTIRFNLDSHQSAPREQSLDQYNHPRLVEDSIYSHGTFDSYDDDSAFMAQELLPPRDFSEADLIAHLKTHPWDLYSKSILQDLSCNFELLSSGIFLKERHHQTDAARSDIYQVGTDGAPIRVSKGDSDEGSLAAWEALKSTNSDESRKQTVGRIIIMREPMPSLFAALHLTLNEYFDMDSIYRILIDKHTPTRALTKGFLKQDHRRQRSVVFVFKYHTVVGEGRAPLHWQDYDEELEPANDHIPLSTCSSVVTLSLAGRPSHTLRRDTRKNKSIVGHIYDPFAPWHVLTIQCFPDWNSTVDLHETGSTYLNGPDAFLAALLAEYRDAVKRFKVVQRFIQVRVVPPKRALVDRLLRDQLLFESDQFRNTRGYFWASQTSEVVADEIREMIATYQETFTDEFWSGEHMFLFPGTEDQSTRYSNLRKKWRRTRQEFEKEIAQLEEALATLQQLEKQIKSRWEWMFSGTSIREAKITVEQGKNIRLLTLVTLFYLPLSYVTGVYGMTNMPPDHSYLPFAVTTIGICVPTYLLILFVNNPKGMGTLLASIALIFTRITPIVALRNLERPRSADVEAK